MVLKVKKLDEKAVLPKKMHSTDAGMDLTAIKITTELSEDSRLVLVYHTGLSIEIPEGHIGLLLPKSEISKKSLALTNCVGIITSNDKEEVVAKFVTITNAVPAIYREGERFAQLVIMPYPNVEVEEVIEPIETNETAMANEAANKIETVEE